MEAQEVKTPEQLQLDFSARDDTAHAEAFTGAVVYQLAQFRGRDTLAESSLAVVYDAIYDAVKHVRVRRPVAPQDAADSRFC